MVRNRRDDNEERQGYWFAEGFHGTMPLENLDTVCDLRSHFIPGTQVRSRRYYRKVKVVAHQTPGTKKRADTIVGPFKRYVRGED
jgi:hypothetical protein